MIAPAPNPVSEPRTMPRLTDCRVLTFDCYGTLIDWEGGIWDALQPLIMRGGGSAVTRDAGLLAFAKWEAHHEHESPELRYPDLLARVHHSIAESVGLETSDALGRGVRRVGGALAGVPGHRGRAARPQATLPAGHPVQRASRRFRRLEPEARVEFDAIYTAEDIGSYKPADANFEYMLAHLKSDFGLERTDVLHTAQSLRHDHAPANRFGLANVWIDRQRLSEGGSWGATEKVESMPATDYVFFSMGEMAAAVEAEAA